MMMRVARKLLGSAKWICSHLPIRLELRMTMEEEKRMVRSGCSNSYRKEEAHIQLEV